MGTYSHIHRSALAALMFTTVILLSCDDDDSDAPPPTAGSASIVAGVNPPFDTVTEVATSSAADGPYAAATGATYDPATESVTLSQDASAAGGVYVRISGTATIGGETASYTVYTFLPPNTTRAAANELTSLAVGAVANGTAQAFAAGVDHVAALTGVDAASITQPATEAERDPALRAAMIALSHRFADGGFDPGITDVDTVAGSVESCVNLGALVFDEWVEEAAGGLGVLPDEEPNIDYTRCKSCHGWDHLGMDGGYVRRSQRNTRPNAGLQDTNTASRNISPDPVFGRLAGTSIAMDRVLHGTDAAGRSWGEGSAAFDAVGGPGAALANAHPDLSATGVNAGKVLPSAEQIRCVTAFINHPQAWASSVFSAIDTATNPVTYTMVAGADAAAGKAYYDANCVACHDAPNDPPRVAGEFGDLLDGGILEFLAGDGKFSELRHKMHWGVPVPPNALGMQMTREALGNPSAADVANVLAYLQCLMNGTGTCPGAPIASDDAVATAQDTALENIDILANDVDPDGGTLTVTNFDTSSAQGGTVSCTVAGICAYTPPAGFSGQDSFGYTISDGQSTDTATVTVTVTAAGGGDTAAGLAVWNSKACGTCHSLGSFDTTTAFNAPDLAGRGFALVPDLATIDPLMTGMTLTAQEQEDLAAFLDSFQ